MSASSLDQGLASGSHVAATASAGEASVPPRAVARPSWADLTADQSLWAVLLIWAFCWLCWAIFLDRFASPLPFAEEYDIFVAPGIATGQRPLTWAFLWQPINEHRQPLARLGWVLMGRACKWNFRHMHQVQLALLALSCLVLLFAVRRARGRARIEDAFLPLLILSSAHYASLESYLIAFALPLSLWLLTAAAVMVRWQLRSVGHLVLYVLGAVAATWSGGPPANLWGLGLCVPLLLGWFAPTGRAWKAIAALGGVAVAGSAVLLLCTMPPPPPQHLAFLSESWRMTCRAALKVSVGWLGGPVLEVAWPWALLLLLVPLLYLMIPLLRDLRRLHGRALLRWMDLTALLAASALILLAIAHGRARSGQLWTSRYCMLQAPIAVALYLLLARVDAPRILTGALAVAMAISVGWCWPGAIAYSQALRAQRAPLNAELRDGHVALSVVIERYPDGGAGWWRSFGRMQGLIACLDQLRSAGLSLFARQPALARQCLYWHADAGKLPDSLRPLVDSNAVDQHAVQALADGPAPTAVYDVAIPANGVYKLCCRWSSAAPGASYTVAVDEGPPLQQAVPGRAEYVPIVLEPGLSLTAGKHRLSVRWPGPGSRLDVLELNPQ